MTMNSADVPNIDFENCFYALLEQEETIWATPEGFDNDASEDGGDVGTVLLRAAISHTAINNYFSKFKPHKCRTRLTTTGCKTMYSSVRVVGTNIKDSSLEEGAMKRDRTERYTVEKLSESDSIIYKDALFCAMYPKLCAPDPPSTPPSPKLRRHSVDVSTLITHIPIDTPAMETDDCDENTMVISSETLCDLLRHAFGLSREMGKQYERVLIGRFAKKPQSRILAEELKQQLSNLENNNDPFYNPHNFLNPHAYDQWQQWRRKQLTFLLSKFWHSLSLPNSSMYRQRKQSRHLQYQSLMKKLLDYENMYRFEVDGENDSIIPTSPLSSATKRLLKEFALRYGICDMYCKITYLAYLTENFEHLPWFINHVSSVIDEISGMLPANHDNIVMVKEELEILTGTIIWLQKHCKNALTRVQRLFPGNITHHGISAFLELLERILRMKVFITTQEELPVLYYINEYMKEGFQTSYERHKMLLVNELKLDTYFASHSPTLLNKLIGKIKDEVDDYKTNYSHSFGRYCDIGADAAKMFYQMLMIDVSILCDEFTEKPATEENMVLMASLSYSLKSFDSDWNSYLTDDMKTWHQSFYPLGKIWLSTIKTKIHDLVKKTIEADKFEILTLPHKPSPNVSNFMDGITTVHHKFRARSSSLTHSMNSAFSTPGSPSVTKQHSSASTSKRSSIDSCVNGDTTKVENITESTSDVLKTCVSEPLAIQNLKHSYQKQISLSHDPNVKRNKDKTLLPRASTDDCNHLLFSSEQPIQKGKLHITSENKIKQTDDNKLNDPNYSSTISSSSSRDIDSQFEYKLIAEYLKKYHQKAYGDWDPELRKKLYKIARLMLSDLNMTSRQNLSKTSFITTEQKESSATLSKQDIQLFLKDAIQFSRLLKPNTNDVSSPLVVTKCISDTVRQDTVQTMEKCRAYGNPYVIECLKPTEIVSIETNTNNYSVESKGFTAYVKKMFQRSPRKDDPNVSCDDQKDILNKKKLFNQKMSLKDDVLDPESQTNAASDTRCLLMVTSSLLDMTILIHRYIQFAKCLLFETIMPIVLPEMNDHTNILVAQTIQCRSYLYNRFILGVCASVTLYCDNLVCMDLCGSQLELGAKLIGNKIINHLEVQYRSGLIWGCRHAKLKDTDCLKYVEHHAKVLADKYEPITKEMCFRINNMYSMLKLITDIKGQVERAANIEKMSSIMEGYPFGYKETNYSTEYDFEVVHTYTPPFLGEDDTNSNINEDDDDGMTYVNGLRNQQDFLLCTEHIHTLFKGQIQLLAYRINLFIKETLHLLLALPLNPSATVSYHIKPLMEFLQIHFMALNKWLYGDIIRKVQTEIWHNLVSNMSYELDQLLTWRKNTETKAKIMIQVLAHLIAFMHVHGKKMSLDELTDDVDLLSFKLNLYAESTEKLIALYIQLKDVFDDDVSSKASDLPPANYLEFMQHQLHSVRKCFSGTDLITWIKKHPQDNYICNSEPAAVCILQQKSMNDEAAITLAQLLLDQGVICSIDDQDIMDWEGCVTESSVTSDASSLESTGYYPPITPYESGHASKTMTVSCTDSDDTAPPSPVPYFEPISTQQKNLKFHKETNENRVINQTVETLKCGSYSQETTTDLDSIPVLLVISDKVDCSSDLTKIQIEDNLQRNVCGVDCKSSVEVCEVSENKIVNFGVGQHTTVDICGNSTCPAESAVSVDLSADKSTREQSSDACTEMQQSSDACTDMLESKVKKCQLAEDCIVNKLTDSIDKDTPSEFFTKEISCSSSTSQLADNSTDNKVAGMSRVAQLTNLPQDLHYVDADVDESCRFEPVNVLVTNNVNQPCKVSDPANDKIKMSSQDKSILNASHKVESDKMGSQESCTNSGEEILSKSFAPIVVDQPASDSTSTISHNSPFSEVSLSPSVLFFPADNQYYCFTSILDISLKVLAITNAKLDDFLERVKTLPFCRNLGTLIHTAIEKKIAASYLVTILYTRRKYDKVAKQFIERLPREEINEIIKDSYCSTSEVGCFG